MIMVFVFMEGGWVLIDLSFELLDFVFDMGY